MSFQLSKITRNKWLKQTQLKFKQIKVCTSFLEYKQKKQPKNHFLRKFRTFCLNLSVLEQLN